MTWTAQHQVRSFMKLVAGQETPPRLRVPGPDVKALRISLMVEELHELEMAMAYDDLTLMADGLADLLYVVIGTAVAYGMDIEPIFDEVHRSNMTKKGGPQRKDGKALKPETYEPPDLAPILTKML